MTKVIRVGPFEAHRDSAGWWWWRPVGTVYWIVIGDLPALARLVSKMQAATRKPGRRRK